MEHSSCSHPLPHGRDASPRLSARPSYRPPSPSLTASTPSYHVLTPQTRRLQLRNARFNGLSLSTRRLSPLLGLVPCPIESFNRPQDSDNSPLSAEKRSLYGESIPPSPVNILQEIQNSARKKAISPTSSFGMMFEDQQSIDENSKPIDDEDLSWYDERSNECSPIIRRRGSFTTGLRESSLNQRSLPPPNSLSAKQTVQKSGAHSSLHSDNVEQSRHIEHLESQLVSAQAKIDSLTSPKTSKMRSVKLRSLAVENRNLRAEIVGWASKAEEMIQNERLRYADSEVEMKLRLQALEEDVEIKDARIAEFEWELESMRTQVKDAEGLEEANATLEKKIDMLSSLLVSSPDKHEPAASPTKCLAPFSPSRRTRRPASILSRESSSPTGKRLSLASVSEAAFWESRSRSASIVESPEDPSSQENHNERAQIPTPDGGMISPDSSKRLSYSDSTDEHTNWTSLGTRTGPSSSRPTSFMSTSSTGAPAWGVPMLPDGDSGFNNRQRRMRKFPSGTSTLKPLILPVATTGHVQSLPASASTYPSIESVAYRDISNSSCIEPNASFLSVLADSSHHPTPTVLSRRRSAKSEREKTLNALEGKTRPVGRERKEIDPETCIASVSPSEGQSQFSSSHHGYTSSPRSLQKELELAEVEQAHLNALGISASNAVDDNLTSETSRLSTNNTPINHARRATLPGTCSTSSQNNEVKTPSTPKASNPAADHPRSLFTRVTDIIVQTKQDPFVLARRILANAWTLGSASMGGMGWWLIGPLHHHQRNHALEGSSNADPYHSTDGSREARHRGHSNWQHFSAEVRNGRVVDTELLRENGSSLVAPSKPRSRDMRDDNNAALPFLSRSPRGEPHLFPCDECVEPSSKRTFRIWFQFSLAVVLAVGLAVKHGPGVLLADPPDGEAAPFCPRDPSKKIDDEQGERRRRRHERIASQSNEYGTFDYSAGIADKSKLPTRLLNNRNGTESGYGSIAFAETLGPADFEAG